MQLVQERTRYDRYADWILIAAAASSSSQPLAGASGGREATGAAAFTTSAAARWSSCTTTTCTAASEKQCDDEDASGPCGPWPADTSASALLAAEPGRRKLHRLFSLTDDVADGVGSGTDSTDLERH